MRMNQVAEEIVVPEGASHNVGDLGEFRVARVAQNNVCHGVNRLA
jgi:hypothetical protein